MNRIFALLPCLVMAACSSTQYSVVIGKSSSDQAGDNDFPIHFIAVNGVPVTENRIRVEPGSFLFSGAPDNPWVRGKVYKKSWHVNVLSCTRYAYVARFEDPKKPEWNPVLVETEEISGCREKLSASDK